MSQSQSPGSKFLRQGRWFGFIPWGTGGFHHAGDSDQLDWEVAFDPDAEHPPLIPSGYPSEAFSDGDTFRMLSVVHRNGKPTPAFTTWEDYEAWDSERSAREWAGKPLESEETTRLLRAVVDDLPPDVQLPHHLPLFTTIIIGSLAEPESHTRNTITLLQPRVPCF